MRIPVVIVADLVALGAATLLVLIAAWLFMDAMGVYAEAARLAARQYGTCVWLVHDAPQRLVLNIT